MQTPWKLVSVEASMEHPDFSPRRQFATVSRCRASCLEVRHGSAELTPLTSAPTRRLAISTEATNDEGPSVLLFVHRRFGRGPSETASSPS